MIQAIRRHEARRGDSQAGFTLIELLVVIIILGILAAVVVFAVSGVGDKGKASAYSIDARTIRTAQEAHCAQNGRYASGEELVSGGFLSELPTYHQTDTTVAGTPDASGNCGGSAFLVTCSAELAGCGAGGALKVGWQEKTPTGMASTTDIVFVDALRGWAVSEGGNIRRTTDGGTTWQPQTSPVVGDDLLAVDFVDANNGWAITLGGAVIRTRNGDNPGGSTWVIEDDTTAGTLLLDVDFVDQNRGMAVGDCGVIIGTDNGSALIPTWTVRKAAEPGCPRLWRAVNFFDANNVWVVGDPTNPGMSLFNNIFRSTAGGSAGSWVAAGPGLNAVFTDVKFVSATVGWAVGVAVGAGIYRTTDGGASWSTTPAAGNRHGVDFVNARQGWTVGITANFAPGGIQATLDGGATWTIQKTVPSSMTFESVDFLDIAHGWAVNFGGRVFFFGRVTP